MKRIYLFSLVALPLFMAGLVAFPEWKNDVETAPVEEEVEVASEITWMSMSEALEANQKKEKLIFIDVYTDWCGWCKVMDRETFAKEDVAKYMNEHFYCVKLNAEKDDPVSIDGREFKLVDAGKRQIHTLAYALLDGQLSYPSYVYLNSDLERIRISKGFKKPEPFMQELQTIVKSHGTPASTGGTR